MIRKIVAIGDLHGDYYRLVRLLEKENAIISENELWKWNPNVKNLDLILLGDYCDWRGEPLEGPLEEWIYGGARIIEFLLTIKKELAQLKATDSQFSSNIFTLIGNHDSMLIEGYEIYRRFTTEEINFIFDSMKFPNKIIQKFSSKNEKLEDALKFLNWLQQGGERTISSYGAPYQWVARMEESHYKFFKELTLGIIINSTLFAHSLPDSKKYWLPLDEIEKLPEEKYNEALQEFMWGRKVWGYDVFSGKPTIPFTYEEIEELLRILKVKRAVIGHTPMRSIKPIVAYNGKIINLDLHGIPGSSSWVVEYETSS